MPAWGAYIAQTEEPRNTVSIIDTDRTTIGRSRHLAQAENDEGKHMILEHHLWIHVFVECTWCAAMAWEAKFEAKCEELLELQAQFDEFQSTSGLFSARIFPSSPKNMFSGQIEDELDKELKQSQRDFDKLSLQCQKQENQIQQLSAEIARGNKSSDVILKNSQLEVTSLREEVTLLTEKLCKLESQNENFQEKLRFVSFSFQNKIIFTGL